MAWEAVDTESVNMLVYIMHVSSKAVDDLGWSGLFGVLSMGDGGGREKL